MAMSTSAVGQLLRDWRDRRRRSQMGLALDVGVSARHLSFVETGRSRPSPELVLAIAEQLEVPLRERNTMLLAAGYAPRYSERSLDDPDAAPVRAAITRMLDAHDPYPGVVIDRQWNVVAANRAAGLLATGVPDFLLGPPLNVYRVCLHPEGLAARTVNFAEWAGYLLQQLRRSAAITGDPALHDLLAEVTAYPNVASLATATTGARDDTLILIPVTMATADGDLSMFTTLTSFGTPRDVTFDEIAVELFFPADPASAEMLRAAALLAPA